MLHALLIAVTMSKTPNQVVPQHPTNAGGYVTDGSPQNDDWHCTNAPPGQQFTLLQEGECLEARRPQCTTDEGKDWSGVVSCWAPITNLYGWDTTTALHVIYCESRGDVDSPHGGLMQLQSGGDSNDGAVNIYDAYNDYYMTRGWEPWHGDGAV